MPQRVVGGVDVNGNSVTIHVYTVCWNEEQMMPHFLNHYGELAERIIVYDNMSTDSTRQIVQSYPNTELRLFDTNGVFDDVENIKLKNTAYQESRGIADFVVVVDADEFVYHPDLHNLLLEYKRAGITLPKTRGYDMVSWRFPPPSRKLVDSVRWGRERAHYSKRSIFDPAVDINFSVGAHKCTPVGDVVDSAEPEIQLLHFHYVGLLRCLHRHSIIRSRLSQWHLQRPGAAVQYKWGSTKVIIQFFRTRLRSHDVVRSKKSVLSRLVAPAYRIRDVVRRRPGGRGMAHKRPITVMRVPLEPNPAITLAIDALRKVGIDTTSVGYLDIRLARGVWTHDIVHVDWLDGFVRTTRRPRERLVAQTYLALVLLGAVVRRRPIFWTLHNAEPHTGAGRAWRVWKRIMARLATDTIVLSKVAANHAGEIGLKGSLIESGFGSFLGVHPRVPREVARAQWAPSGARVVLVHFGQIREQKGVTDVLAAMGELEGDDVRLIIAGPVASPRLNDLLTAAEAADPRVAVIPRFLTDEELGSLLSAADIALMPFHASLTTSSAHVAAELGVAIVAPDVELFRPYGSRYLYQPKRGTPGLVEAARRAVSDARSGDLRTPSFVAPDWADVVEPVAQAYRHAVVRPRWRRFG